jgi:hypothetical protein
MMGARGGFRPNTNVTSANALEKQLQSPDKLASDGNGHEKRQRGDNGGSRACEVGSIAAGRESRLWRASRSWMTVEPRLSGEVQNGCGREDAADALLSHQTERINHGSGGGGEMGDMGP